MYKKCFFIIFIACLLMFAGCQDEVFDPLTFEVDISKFDSGLPQHEQNQAAEGEFQRAEKSMMRMLDIIKDKYKDNKVVTENISKSQNAWKEYREFHLLSVFPKPDFQWGAVYKMSYSLEKARMTWLRVKELYKWIAPGIAGETYPDSYHGSYGMYKRQITDK